MNWIDTRARSIAQVAAIAVLACSAVAIAAQSPENPSLSAAAPQDPAVAAIDLAGLISAELASLPDTSTAEDFEAFIIFRVDQGNYPPEVVERALALLGKSSDSPLLKAALENVRLALLKRKRGTAAIVNTSGTGLSGFGGGGGPNGASTFTTPPSTGGGDGGSNYGA